MPTEQAEKLISWVRESLESSLGEVWGWFVEEYTSTREGREQLAQAYVGYSQVQIQDAINGTRSAAQGVCLRIEGFISCFPEEERFSEPLIRIRENLMELYAYLLDPRLKGDSYSGPRVSRYKRDPVI